MKLDTKTNAAPSYKAQFTAIGSVVIAFLASQHHLIHMLILSVTFGAAGMSAMNDFPLLRRGMMLISLLMVGVTIWQLWRSKRHQTMRVLGAVSVVLTLGLLIWSVSQFGL